MASFIAFGLDRFSKIIIVHWLDLASVQTIHVWPPYINFVMAWNKGVNFGFLNEFNGRWLLVTFGVGCSLILVFWASNKPGWVLPLASGAIIGGALGNVVDRVIYGSVADYLNISCCTINNPFSFNVADIFIFGGATLLFFGNETEFTHRK